MATGATDREDRDVSVGRVFGRAVATIAGNPGATLGIAFALGAAPTLLMSFVLGYLRSGALDALGGALDGLATMLALVLAVLSAVIIQGALVRATLAHDEGRAAGFAECARTGLAVAVPLFLLALVSGLGILLGLLLLIVPGVFLYLAWSVAAPALVEEPLKPVAALRRSFELTRGARWKILALFLVAYVFYLLLIELTGVPAATGFGGFVDFSVLAGEDMSAFRLLLTVSVQTLAAAAWSVLQASLYIELRDWKDGPGTNRLADIFA